MAKGKGKRGTGDNSSPSSNHLTRNRSIDKRSTNMNQKTILCAATALSVPDSSVTANETGTITVEVNKEDVHGVEKEQEARHEHIDRVDKDDEEHSPGFIFMCSGETKAECFKYSVFGLPAGQLFVVQNIKPGTNLFLFDVNLKLLYGVYKATSEGAHGLEPYAFGGRYPAQVRFSFFRESFPVPESVFRHAIKENYRGGRKFQQQLSNHQVKKLFALFRSVDGPPEPLLGAPPRHFPPVNIYQNQQPLTDPYDPMAHHHAHHTPPPLMSGYKQSATQTTNTNPYTGYLSVQKKYSLQLLLAERKREQKRELVQQFGCASDSSTQPSHAAGTAYAVASSHAISETERGVSPHMPVHHTPHKLVSDASAHALPVLHQTPPPASYDASTQAYVPGVSHNMAPSYATPPPVSYHSSSQFYVSEASGLGPAYWTAVARQNSNQVYDASAHALPPLHQTPPPLSYDASYQAYVPAAPHIIAPSYGAPSPVAYDPSSQAYVPAAPYNIAPSYATPPPVLYDPSSQVYVHEASEPGPAYWEAVAREGPNQSYIDPHRS